MSNVIQMPVVAGEEVTTDAKGRFNLNALHRASGGEPHKAPNKWLRSKQAQELAMELESQTPDLSSGQKVISVVNGGVSPGTFAHEILAVEYAGWISAAFRIKVNQVFIDYRTGKLTPTNQQRLSRKDLAQMVIEAEEEAEMLRLENKAKEDKIEKLESFFHPGMTITAFGKMLNGVNCAQLSNYCCEVLSWLYNESRSGNSKRWRVKSTARDRFLTETNRPIGSHGGETFIKHEPKLLQDGAKKLYELYLAGRLPMKKTWNGEFVHMKFGAVAA